MAAGWGTALVVASWLQAASSAPAQEPAQLPGVVLPSDLARVLADYEREWSARNAAGLARLFAEDGFVLPGGRPPVRGREAIERHYTGSGGPLALRALAYGVDGRTGYIIGGYATRRGDPDDGKFTLTLRKAPDGRWLIVSDMDSSNRRPGVIAGSSGAAVSELRAIMDETSASWNRGDLDAFIAPYDEQATFMARRGPIGIPDMRAGFEKNYFTHGKPNQQLRYEQLSITPLAGDSALMTGRFILSGGGLDEQSGWFTLVWTRKPAGWRIVHDHSS